MKMIKDTMARCGGFSEMPGAVVDKIPAAPQIAKQTAAARRRRRKPAPPWWSAMAATSSRAASLFPAAI